MEPSILYTAYTCSWLNQLTVRLPIVTPLLSTEFAGPVVFPEHSRASLEIHQALRRIGNAQSLTVTRSTFMA